MPFQKEHAYPPDCLAFVYGEREKVLGRWGTLGFASTFILTLGDDEEGVFYFVISLCDTIIHKRDW